MEPNGSITTMPPADPAPGTGCRDLLFIATPDYARAHWALGCMDRALAGAGIGAIYHCFLFGSDGTYSVWVAAHGGTPVPGSAASQMAQDLEAQSR